MDSKQFNLLRKRIGLLHAHNPPLKTGYFQANQPSSLTKRCAKMERRPASEALRPSAGSAPRVIIEIHSTDEAQTSVEKLRSRLTMYEAEELPPLA